MANDNMKNPDAVQHNVEDKDVILFKKLQEKLKDTETPMIKIFSEVETMVNERGLKLPEKPANWIIEALDRENQRKVLLQWLVQAEEPWDDSRIVTE